MVEPLTQPSPLLGEGMWTARFGERMPSSQAVER